MKNHATNASRQTTPLPPVSIAVGLDVSDRTCELCVVGEENQVLERAKFRNTREALALAFVHRAPMRVALEVGTHSRWISRALKQWGHEAILANPRKVRLISQNHNKRDPVDAEILARLARVDPQLLHPIRHRSEQRAQALAVIRARDPLVEARVLLVNHVRGAVKPVGGRIAPCSTESFARKAAEQLPRELASVLQPVLDQIQSLTHVIRRFDREIERLATETFPETAPLRQIPGVGSLTALAFVLTLDDPSRFPDARDVGAYLGLCPRQGQSGESDPQLGITKAGDPYVRKLLVQSAHYTLGRFGQDSDLRRWGLRLAKQSPPAPDEKPSKKRKKKTKPDKDAKKKAVVAVARKLSVILFRLWERQSTYEPFRTPPERKHRKKADELKPDAPASPIGEPSAV